MQTSPIADRLAAIQPDDPDTTRLLASLFQPIALDKGQLLCGPSLNGRSLYLLHTGILQHYRMEEGNSCTIDLVLPGSFLGSPAVLPPPSQLDYVCALTPCRLYACPQFRIERQGSAHPPIYAVLLAVAQQRLQNQHRLNQMLRIQPAGKRKQAMAQALGPYLPQLPKQVLASYLSLSRKHLGRLDGQEKNSTGHSPTKNQTTI